MLVTVKWSSYMYSSNSSVPVTKTRGITNVPVKLKLQHPPWATPLAFEILENSCSNSPLAGPKSCSNAPTPGKITFQ